MRASVSKRLACRHGGSVVVPGYSGPETAVPAGTVRRCRGCCARVRLGHLPRGLSGYWPRPVPTDLTPKYLVITSDPKRFADTKWAFASHAGMASRQWRAPDDRYRKSIRRVGRGQGGPVGFLCCGSTRPRAVLTRGVSVRCGPLCVLKCAQKAGKALGRVAGTTQSETVRSAAAQGRGSASPELLSRAAAEPPQVGFEADLWLAVEP